MHTSKWQSSSKRACHDNNLQWQMRSRWRLFYKALLRGVARPSGGSQPSPPCWWPPLAGPTCAWLQVACTCCPSPCWAPGLAPDMLSTSLSGAGAAASPGGCAPSAAHCPLPTACSPALMTSGMVRHWLGCKDLHQQPAGAKGGGGCST